MSSESEELNFEGKAPKVWYTHDVKKAIQTKYTDKGQHLVVFEVQDTAGTRGQQYCDAVVIGNWSSTGREIWGMEIKASRADWLRELKKPDKSDAFTAQCDRWWLVTTDRAIVKDGELPADWGWLCMTKTGGLRVEKHAPKLPHAAETAIRRGWAYAIMRRCYEKDGEAMSRALNKQREEMFAMHRAEMERAVAAAKNKGDAGPFEALKKKVEEFEATSGCKLDHWEYGDVGANVKLLKEALRYRSRDSFINSLREEAKALSQLAQAFGEFGKPIDPKDAP